MRVIHLMNDEKFRRDICGFYNKFYNNGQHEIAFINFSNKSMVYSDYEIKQFDIFMKKFDLKSVNKMFYVLQAYDYIVLHSWVLINLMQIKMLLNKKINNKIIWIEWGFDLYELNRGKTLKSFISYHIGKILRKRCFGFVAIFPPDRDLLKKYAGEHTQIFYAPYCGYPLKLNYKDYKPNYEKSEKKPIYIQIGHNASPTLNHIEVLNKLKKFSNEDIQILLPLSYSGSEEYVNEVYNEATRLFPGKVICLREMMDISEYFKLLDKVDISIFNTYRQAGLANIVRLFFYNKKVYLPEESIMYKFFYTCGAPIGGISNIDKMNFSEFVANDRPRDEKKYYDLLRHFSDSTEQYQCWEKVYRYLDDLTTDKHII